MPVLSEKDYIYKLFKRGEQGLTLCFFETPFSIQRISLKWAKSKPIKARMIGKNSRHGDT